MIKLVNTIKSYILNGIQSTISNMKALKNALAVGFLRLLPNRATPLVMSLTIRPFGFVLLALLLPILWKFWPDAPATSLQPEITPTVEAVVDSIPETSAPNAGISEQPAPEPEPTPPEQSQGWSRVAEWGLFIVGVGAMLIGIVTVWYYWPTEPTVETVRQIIDQATLANYNILRDALAGNQKFHDYIRLLNDRDVYFRSRQIYQWYWELGSDVERKLWNLIRTHAKYPITKEQVAGLLNHFDYSVVTRPALQFVEEMNSQDSIRAIPKLGGITLDSISDFTAATSTAAKWQLVGYLLLVGGTMIVVTVLAK